MRDFLVSALFATVLASPAVAAPRGAEDAIFHDGFEACCTVGGTASGLAGSGLVLHLAAGTVSENLSIPSNGPWRFTTLLGFGVAWSVSIQTQPSSGPGCQISNASGSMGHAPIDSVVVQCGSFLQWDAGQWGDLWQ